MFAEMVVPATVSTAPLAGEKLVTAGGVVSMVNDHWLADGTPPLVAEM
jgi:hypothetical protein